MPCSQMRLLDHAGLALNEEDRARLQSCTDAATLDRWLENFLRGAKSAAAVLS